MPDKVRIENLTNRPVILALNSQTTLHLSPHHTSKAINDVEIKNNPMVAKLESRHIIALHESTSQPRSGEMSAAEAIAHIKNTPLEELQGFLSEDEDRATVLQAWKEKHGDS
jgi:hypothetical protein